MAKFKTRDNVRVDVYVPEHGHSVTVWDGEVETKDKHEIEALEAHPDVVKVTESKKKKD